MIRVLHKVSIKVLNSQLKVLGYFKHPVKIQNESVLSI